jgi:hypothetical protein
MPERTALRLDFFAQWTRTQRIRTTTAIRVEAVILDQIGVPVYLSIAVKAKHLRELGMSDRAIARRLGVSDKTVARAARFPDPPTASELE